MQVQRCYAYFDDQKIGTRSSNVCLVSTEDPDHQSIELNTVFYNMANPCHLHLTFKGTVYPYEPQRWAELRQEGKLARCAKCCSWAHWSKEQEAQNLCDECVHK